MAYNFLSILVPCRIKSDIVIVLDSTGSLGQSNYLKGINFAQIILPNYVISSGGVNIGVIYFSQTATTVVEMNSPDGRSEPKIKQALEALKRRKSTGLSYINVALTQAEQMLQRGRRGVPEFVIIITDGRNTNDATTIDEPLRRLKNREATVLVAENGWRPLESTLVKLSGEKSRIQRLKVPSDMWKSAEWIALQTCSARRIGKYCL